MLKDFLAALKNKDLWIYLSWYDVISKYRRTTLGPFWMIIMTFITIFGMALLCARLFKVKVSDFLPYVACGMIVWGYITSIIIESCSVFLAQAPLIQNTQPPLLTYGLRLFLKNTIIFLHSLVILFILLYFYSTLSIHLVMLIPAFLIIAINSVSFSIILGFFSSRYRDILHMVQATLNLLALLSPIMWKVEMLGEYTYLANINPFTHFIALFREPLLGHEISTFSLQYVFVATLAGAILAQYLYTRFRNRLVFWL